MPHINQSSIQEIVENAQEGEILNIKEVLESRGFAPDLSTLTIDFSNNKSSLVNFTGIDLTLAEIKNLDHSKSVIFEDGSSTLSPFNPDSLIRNYSFQQSTLVLSHITKLNYTGVCFGIAVEMARYIAKRKAQNRNADIKKLSREFIVKLFRKTKNLDKNMNYKSSDNFLRRIMIYQTSQTFSGMIKKHRINRNVDSSKRSGFFETMPEDIKNARMIGIGYGASKNRGHIINIFREQDNIGRNRYIIFDSNIGLVPRNHIIDESEKYYYTSDEIARFVNSKAAEKKFCCYNFDKILDELNLTSSKLGENPNDINQERCLLNIKTLETSLTKLDQMLADKNRAPNTEKRILPYINLSLEIIDQLSEGEIRNNPQFLRLASRNLPIIQKLLNRGLNINSKDPKSGMTLLHIMASRNNIPAIKYLLDEYAIDPNITDSTNKTPIHIALEKGFIESAKELLSAPNINTDVKAMNLALNNPSDKMLELIIDNNQKFDSARMFIELIQKGYYKYAIMLSEKGVNIDYSKISTKDKNLLYKQLFQRLNENDDMFVNALLKSGVDPNFYPQNDDAILNKILLQGEFLKAKKLIDLGAKTDIPDKNGETALHILSRSNNENMLKLAYEIVESGNTDIRAMSKRKRHPFFEAISSENYKLAALMLEKTPEVLLDENSDNYISELFRYNKYSKSPERLHLIKLVLQNNSNISKLLDLPYEDMKILVGDFKNRINEQCTDGNSLLHKSVTRGYDSLLKTKDLIKEGALLNPLNYDGDSPLDLLVKKSIMSYEQDPFGLIPEDSPSVPSEDISAPSISQELSDNAKVAKMLIEKGAKISDKVKSMVKDGNISDDTLSAVLNEEIQKAEDKEIKNIFKIYTTQNHQRSQSAPPKTRPNKKFYREI